MITYLSSTSDYTADVREPKGEGHKLICHCVNSANKMGAGVARALFEKWPTVRSKYIEKGNIKPHELGEIQIIPVESDISVINLVGQQDTFWVNGIPPVRYEAVKKGLEQVAWYCELEKEVSIHFPYLACCDLAGGEWSIIENIIKETLSDKGINVFIYDIFNKYNGPEKISKILKFPLT